MKKSIGWGLIFSLLTGTACVPDRTFTGDNLPVPPPPPGQPTLLLNEFVCGGSQQTNEFGTAEDWLELYNPAPVPLEIGANEWFVTDDSTNQTKYALPPGTVPPRGFLVVWCDTRNVVQTQIHTNFNLARAGEAVGVYHVVSGEVKHFDYYAYPTQVSAPDGASLGREPDGGPTWRQYLTPTQGQPNR